MSSCASVIKHSTCSRSSAAATTAVALCSSASNSSCGSGNNLLLPRKNNSTSADLYFLWKLGAFSQIARDWEAELESCTTLFKHEVLQSNKQLLSGFKQTIGLENQEGDGKVIAMLWWRESSIWRGKIKHSPTANLFQKCGSNLHAGSTLDSFCSQRIEPRLPERLRKGLESEKNKAAFCLRNT